MRCRYRGAAFRFYCVAMQSSSPVQHAVGCELCLRKEARRKALKKKADDTKETGQSFEGEEFGKDYVPPESSSVSPAFFKSI